MDGRYNKEWPTSSTVIVRLQECGIRGTALQEEWQAIQSMTDEESSFCMAAARLGLDPLSEAREYEAAILNASERLSHDDLFDDFLDSVEPSEILASIEWVTKTQNEIESLDTTGNALTRLRSELGGAGILPSEKNAVQPWEIGWQQARLVRSAMKLNTRDRLPIDSLLSSVLRTAPTKGVQALGVTKANPTIVLAHPQRAITKRFTLARALWHLLWREPKHFLITVAHTDVQKAERAFAAELLAPAAGIAERADGDVLAGLDEDILDELSAAYGVSPIVVQHPRPRRVSYMSCSVTTG